MQPTADPFVALLSDCEAAAASLSISAPALASLTADLVGRNNESALQAFAQTNTSRSILVACKTRALGSAARLLRKQCKKIDADLEATHVSTEQLRVWAGVAALPGADIGHSPHFEFAALSLASPQQVHAPVIDLICDGSPAFAGAAGSVVTGEELRVVSAAGPGLKWFEPLSRNEFSVVLAQADGGMPVWLMSGDLSVTVLLPADGNAPVGVQLTAMSSCNGTVGVVYGGLPYDASAVAFQVTVCGQVIADASGSIEWGVRVPRRPLAGHNCGALGTLVRTLKIVENILSTGGIAVSADEQWLVVVFMNVNVLVVYSLPVGEVVRHIGGSGDGPLQFAGLRRLCFAPNGHLLVVDRNNKRLQEVSLEGVFVRFIGAGELGDCKPCSVDLHNDVIAVGCSEDTGVDSAPCVVLFDFTTGAMTSRFRECGALSDPFCDWCTAVRFTADGSHVIVADAPDWGEEGRLSLFALPGVLVSSLGKGVLGGGLVDVIHSTAGEFVVTDSANHRVCVFSTDSLELVRSWGERGTGAGRFEFPNALAAAGKHLYVVDSRSGRVQVFE